MRQKKNYSLIKHLDFLFLDFFCVELCFFAACMVRRDTFILLMERYLGMSFILFVTFISIVAFWNIYSGILRRNLGDEFRNTCTLAIYLFVALTLFCFITKTSEDYSRAVLVTFLLLAIPVLFVERIVRKEVLRKKIQKKGGEVLLFIREEDIERKIEQFTNKSQSGVIVTGIVTYEETDKTEVNGIPIVGNKNTLFDYVEKNQVSCVYIYLRNTSVHEYIDFLVRRNVLVYRALRNLEKSTFRYSVTEMNGYTSLCVRERELSIGFAFTKRFMDIVMSLLSLIVSSPVLLVTAIAIKVEDGGPIFYKSKRVGQYGREFDIYKFRSMKLNADRLEDMLTPEELARYYKEFKLENDPRITRVGEFIRRHSIDEMPQFVNILKGDMAFIGPRPLVQKEVEVNYPDDKDLLLSIKPGLTGYWQAFARNHVGYENGERQKMELYYIERSCWRMDLKIIFRTMKVVLTGDGAR